MGARGDGLDREQSLRRYGGASTGSGQLEHPGVNVVEGSIIVAFMVYVMIHKIFI
jgi:hypothetical protein